MKKLVAENRMILVMILLACLLFALLTYFVIIPSYTDSSSKLYTSKLGYPELLRRSGDPLPVKVVKAEDDVIEFHVMGEGVCASQPILVPVIPMSLIKEVKVKEGETVKKGQLLATLDSAKAVIKRYSAKLALSTAKAELERVNLGSAYVLAKERPEAEKINLDSLKEQQVFAKGKLGNMEAAYKEGVIAEVKLFEARKEYQDMLKQIQQAELSSRIAESGVKQSIMIAENAVNDAQQALNHREEELKSYVIHAPADGVVDRVLINPGEYNQDGGKPGFLVSSGLWFDAYFDQSDYEKISKGLPATVNLEAYPGKSWPATVAAIKPVVSFNSGGPEISRPLRPRGSGSPEWAATFKARLEFELPESQTSVIPGMTGFARLKISRKATTVPRSAVLSISAGTAILYVITGEDSWEPRQVRIGHVNDEVAEVLEGVAPGEEVMTDGHWTLTPDDEISIEH